MSQREAGCRVDSEPCVVVGDSPEGRTKVSDPVHVDLDRGGRLQETIANFEKEKR